MTAPMSRHMVSDRRRRGMARVAGAVFAPSTALLGRLGYAKKFGFIGLVLLIPFAFVAREYVRTQQQQIAFSAKERVGVGYIEPLVGVTVEEIERRQRAAAGRRPARLASALARMDAADRRYGATLGLEEDWVVAKRQLLAAARQRPSAANARKQNAATAALLALIVRAGDASNLTLDPDLDSYYLMDALQFRIPAMLDNSSRLVDEVRGVGDDAHGGPADFAVHVGSHVGALETDLTALDRGLGTTVRTTGAASLRRQLPGATRGLRRTTTALTTRLVAAVQAGRPQAVPADAAVAAQSQLATLAVVVAPQLDALLATRIERLERNAKGVTVITVLSVLLAAYLFVGFYRSVGSPVRAMVAVLRAVGDGDLKQTVVVETRDELHLIAEAINHTVARTREVTDRLARQASHDPLTELPNRALILDRLTQGLARARRHDKRLALLFIDLDGFKLVNDLRGHETGDAVLRAVGQRLTGLVRPADTVGRLAGDEFIVLCEDIGETASVLLLARRITEALQEPIPVPGRTDVSVGASVGIAIGEAGNDDPNRLIKDADVAMYRAKDRGRGRVEIFDEALRASVASRDALQEELPRAIAANELVLHYQPIVDADDGRVSAFEALVRWNHPSRGLLSPGEFIPLAEDTGSVVPLGAWVLRTACHQLAEWLAEDPGLAGTAMAVNLSVTELSDPDLVTRVRDTLRDAGLEPSALCLELTESAVMSDPVSARQTLFELGSLGVSLSIDDFGSGYSSLSYLRNLPVQAIKIDRSFVAALGGSPADEAIVGLVADLGQALGLEVVAEGIETDAQLEDVRRLGCGKFQGFHLGRPLPADQARARLPGQSPGAGVPSGPTPIRAA
jgi:diguanylate cyclase (GGDEF)-like protein